MTIDAGLQCLKRGVFIADFADQNQVRARTHRADHMFLITATLARCAHLNAAAMPMQTVQPGLQPQSQSRHDLSNAAPQSMRPSKSCPSPFLRRSESIRASVAPAVPASRAAPVQAWRAAGFAHTSVEE